MIAVDPYMIVQQVVSQLAKMRTLIAVSTGHLRLIPTAKLISLEPSRPTIRQASKISMNNSSFHLQNSCQFCIVWAIGCLDQVLNNDSCLDSVNH